MNYIQTTIHNLFEYKPNLTAKSDLAPFWSRNMQEINEKAFQEQRSLEETPLGHTTVYKVSFEGYDATRIHGWYLLPSHAPTEQLPCVVVFHGYTIGKGLPEHYAHWLLMGIAVLAIDLRGQGGETGNLLPQDYGMSRGWISQGLLDPNECYYKALILDCIQALRWVQLQPEIDAKRIGVIGGSQGGGLALMVSALSPIPSFAVASIPNMCHIDFGIFNSTGSLTEAADFISKFPAHQDQVMDTLSYFDVMNVADQIKIPVLVSVGMKDTICPPETVFAAYNRITSEKELRIYPFNGHWDSVEHLRHSLNFVAHHIQR